MAARKPKTYEQRVIHAMVSGRITKREAVSCLSGRGRHVLIGADLYREGIDFHGRSRRHFVRRIREPSFLERQARGVEGE